MEAVLTFAFSTRIENPVPVLSDAEVRKLGHAPCGGSRTGWQGPKGNQIQPAGFG